MRCGGISLLGRYHSKNQDRFYSAMLSDTVGILIVSDGLGSCSWSGIGAEAFIQAAKEVCNKNSSINTLFQWKECIKKIHEQWLIILSESNHDIAECQCTALLCFVLQRRLYCARLGDGMIGVLADDRVHVLYDDKADCFANETHCLHEAYQEEEWEFYEMPYNHFYGVLSCTDGISIAAGKYEKFTQDFMLEYANKNVEQIQTEIEDWALRWRSNDDKTVAFLLSDIRGGNGAEKDE